MSEFPLQDDTVYEYNGIGEAWPIVDPKEYAYTQAYNAVIGGIYTRSNITFNEFCKKLDETFTGDRNENRTDEDKQIP